MHLIKVMVVIKAILFFAKALKKTIFLEVDLIASHSCLPINAANVHSRFSLKDSKSLKVQPFHE